MAEQESKNDWQGHFKQDFDSLVKHSNDSGFNSEFDHMPQAEQIAMAKKLESYKSAHPGALQDVAIIGADSVAPVVWRTEKQAVDPDQMALTIEGHAKAAVTNEAQAKLDLRKDGEQLSHMDEATRQKVIAKLEADGSYTHPFNGAPHVEEVKENGQITALKFSTMLGVNEDAMPLNKSLDQQKQEAAAAYETAIHDARVMGQDPGLAQRVIERDAAKERGENPPTLGSPKWWEVDNK